MMLRPGKRHATAKRVEVLESDGEEAQGELNSVICLDFLKHQQLGG